MTLRTPPNAQKNWERKAAQMRQHIESRNAMTPAEARRYISLYHVIAHMPTPLTYVDTSVGRRIEMATMTDEEAVQVAWMLQDMEIEAGTPEGVKRS